MDYLKGNEYTAKRKEKGCNDNRNMGCLGAKYQCKLKSIEYLPIYFANNSTMGLPWNNITKFQALDLYFSLQPLQDVCVVNTGMHAAGHNYTDEEYTENVKLYLIFLSKYCRQIIWISITSVLGQDAYSQSNETILRWNHKIDTMITLTFKHIGYIDMYPMSTERSMHVDNVHMDSMFYNKAAQFFTHI